jgi:hypothetical protein
MHSRILLTMAAVMMLGACKGEKPIYLSCSDSALKLPGEIGQTFTIECPQLCTGHSVWGGAENDYTADSSVCNAAIHAGAVPAAGGTTKVTLGKGKAKFKGSSKNGVTTSDWNEKFDKTFSF